MERVQRGETSVFLIYHLSPRASPCWPVAFTNPRLPLLVSRSRSSFLVYRPWPSFPAGVASCRLAWNRSWILVFSLENIPFAYLIKSWALGSGGGRDAAHLLLQKLI